MLGSRQSSHLKESVFFSHMYITHVEGFHSASFLPSFYFRTYLLQRQIYRRKEKQIWHLLVHSHQGLYAWFLESDFLPSFHSSFEIPIPSYSFFLQLFISVFLAQLLLSQFPPLLCSHSVEPPVFRAHEVVQGQPFEAVSLRRTSVTAGS